MSNGDASADLPPGNRWEVFGWTMYDWSSSAYSTLLITVVMMYITTVLIPGTLGATVYAWTISASMLLAAFLSPILGAVADASANKRGWLAATAFGGSALAASLFFIPYEWAWFSVGVIFCSAFCFESSLTFYNGFLPEITDEHTINRVSGYGFAMGYIGGALALVLAIGVLLAGQRVGLPQGNKLTMDFVSTHDAEFRVDLPPGQYRVRLRLGDPASARGPVTVWLNDEAVDEITTQAGQSAVIEGGITLEEPTLRVHIETPPQHATPAALQALSIIGQDNSTLLRFDFGTRGSYAEAGHLWTLDTDTFRTWTEAELTERGLGGADREDRPPLSLPADTEVAFGWHSGEVKSVDAVLPKRLQYGLLILGLWWGLFSIPTIALLRDRGKRPEQRATPSAAVRGAVRKVGESLRSVRNYRTLFLFLVAFLFFNDGIQTVINQASVFAKQELGFVLNDLIALILMIQILALPGALLVGYLADHLGRKSTLMVCLGIWVALVITAYFVTTKIQFWIMGMVLAAVMGGTQAVARAIMGIMTPKNQSAEFFGFYNFSGKATSWMGSALFGLVIYLTGSARVAIVSVLVFFLVGWALVAMINVERGRREALASNPDVAA